MRKEYTKNKDLQKGGFIHQICVKISVNMSISSHPRKKWMCEIISDADGLKKENVSVCIVD